MKKISVSGLVFFIAAISAGLATLGDNPRDLEPWSEITVELLYFSLYCLLLGLANLAWFQKIFSPKGMFVLSVFLLVLGGFFIFGGR